MDHPVPQHLSPAAEACAQLAAPPGGPDVAAITALADACRCLQAGYLRLMDLLHAEFFHLLLGIPYGLPHP